MITNLSANFWSYTKLPRAANYFGIPLKCLRNYLTDFDNLKCQVEQKNMTLCQLEFMSFGNMSKPAFGIYGYTIIFRNYRLLIRSIHFITNNNILDILYEIHFEIKFFISS